MIIYIADSEQCVFWCRWIS